MEDLLEISSASSCLSSSSSSPNLVPLPIDMELWLMAEERTQEILCAIQPAHISDRSRREIIDYVQKLIKGYYGIEVFSFGSVPLKTYLPDGDIDLTVLSHQNVEEDLARDVCCILEGEEQCSDSEVTDVHYIHAQVKIVKCTIKNISVDISFNQMAGLCALCFLEQVDQIIGKDHLFKRSVILIKAWCYYESRILGAHHGLFSTYALETLVLYIINRFHSSLCGPLAVLYKFLDYYSTFDWDNYCVTVSGPVPISFLPEVVAETTENDRDELLLSPEFLRHWKEVYSVPTRAVQNRSHDFPIKNLNIVDPLKDNNNLGRCVSRGNFYRIKYALSYGAQTLEEILMLPDENMGLRIENFFVTTLERNGKGQRSDVSVPVTAFGSGRSEASDLSGDYDGYYNSLVYGQWYHGYTLPASAQATTPPRSPSRVPSRSPWDFLRRLVGFRRNNFYRRNRDLYVPRLPFSHPYISQLPSAPFGFNDTGKSRGTGTYIPNMRHCSYTEMNGHSTARKPGSTSQCSMIHCHERASRTENRPTADGGNSSYLEILAEQHPDLAVIENTAQQINQPDQSGTESPEAGNCSCSLESIIFGSYEHSSSLSEEPQLSTNQADSDFACISSSGSTDEIAPPETFELRDDNDFPPLCM